MISLSISLFFKGTCDSSIYRWSSSLNKCVGLSNYTEECATDSDCRTNLGLICNTGGNACNCPKSLGTGQCDCPRAAGQEYYWNGSSCDLASAYSQSCTFGKNYMCQTLTQSTYCNSVNKCDCRNNGGYSSSSSKCLYCKTDWYFINFICYMVGNVGKKADSQNEIDLGCEKSKYGLSSVSLAKISDATIQQYVDTAKANNKDYWVDAKRQPDTLYKSNDGTWTITTGWCGGAGSQTCAYIDNANGYCYKTGDCATNKDMICQYSL